jgi:hypothetical protein
MMKGTVVAAAIVLALAGAAHARPPERASGAGGTQQPAATSLTEDVGDDGIFWVYVEDFEDPFADDWAVFDLSGIEPQENYWHIDTIRPEDGPGDHSWWCGKYDDCWIQDRGYANDWYQVLSRHFTGVTGSGTETVEVEFDQRFAMEKDYDYAYVDISDDGGDNWVTLATYQNTGTQGAGIPVDWDHPEMGHVVLDISSYSGSDIDLRFRFESDGAYSSADQPNVYPYSVTDGAWQLDNIEIQVDDAATFYDDCESGDTGWDNEAFPGAGQTGVVWRRGQYGIDFWTGRPATCSDPAVGTYMMAAVDPAASKLVDYEYTWLISPPINIAGAEGIFLQYTAWMDCPIGSNDGFDVWKAASDNLDCMDEPSEFVQAGTDFQIGPYWGTWTSNESAYMGPDWFAVGWFIYNGDPPQGSAEHMGGFFLDEVRIGTPSGDATTSFARDIWSGFNDWFDHELGEALLDTAWVRIADTDGVEELYVVASNDGGESWQSYACIRVDPSSDWWKTPPPVDQMTPGSEIAYYYEATDGVGNVAVFPENAPDVPFEMSILPITASVSNPGILLVDKHGELEPGENRSNMRTSEYYYGEMLEILGYEWDVYDVEVPSGTILSLGPDTAGMKYYNTLVYFTNDFDAMTLRAMDQYWLTEWLSMAPEKERNLLLTGNDIAYELSRSGAETLGFMNAWLGAQYRGEVVGHGASDYSDSIPGLVDCAGGWTFMDQDDGACILAGGCPDPIENFDLVSPQKGVIGAEVVAEYTYSGCAATNGAGVAYTHPSMFYQTVILGFGMEFMMDGVCGGTGNYTTEGYFHSGIEDRVNLMGNIMTYFGLTPTGTATGVVEGGYKNALSQAYPNPFNPVTKIAYSVKEAGPVAIEVYNVAGKVVRTLLDTELDAGADGFVVWDGANDSGEKCSSGVYFYRIAAPGFNETKKMIMLK